MQIIVHDDKKLVEVWLTNLEKDDDVINALKYCNENGLLTAAICAAPMVLGKLGILNGKKAVCYTGFEEELKGAEVLTVPSVIDGKIITARGAGVAVDFGLKLVEALYSEGRSKIMGASLFWVKK